MATRFTITSRGKPKLSLSPDVPQKVGLIIAAQIEAQAKAGLVPGKKGGMVTLHEFPGHERLWREVTVGPDGNPVYHSPQAFLLEKYGGTSLRGQFLAEAERQIGVLLNTPGVIRVEYV